ncbi:MAG: TonB-dependent receptor [Gammaproteobacteria bacterium]|nr:TonB-dependent receptor [Gammaproteobacteria bacterium]
MYTSGYSPIVVGALALGFAALLPSGILRAEEAAAGPAAPASTQSASQPEHPLEEIVVTATRREESLSKIPVSVTALTQADMDDKGIKDFLDVARFTPGVSIDNSATNAISIRGISSSGGAGTTGIYIDDTPIQMRSVGFNPDDTLPKTFDLERVEILRGPQGTLFGAGSEGGAVRYILTQPSVSSSSTYMRSEVSYTQYGQPNEELGIAHGAPIIDGTLGFRASAWYREDGGWINRVDPTSAAVVDRNINRSGTFVGRLAAVWQPASSVSVTPSMLYQHQKKDDDSTYWPAYSNPGAGQFNTATPERIPNDDEYYLPAVKLQWDLGGSQFIANASYFHRKQITAYQGTVYDLSYYQTAGEYFGVGCEATGAPVGCPWFPLLDGSGIHLPPGFSGYNTPNVMTNTQQSYTGEARWQSADDSSRLRWTIGAFWQLAKEGSIEELKDTQIVPFFQYLYGIDPTDPAYYGPYYSCPTNANYTAIPACDIYYNANTTFDRQIAGYGELSYAFTDWFRLTLGERVAHTEFTMTHYSDGLENFGPSPATAAQSETPNTPKATLSFQVDPNDLYYATYAKGFRVGGGNAPLPAYCDADLAAAGYPNGAPLTYKSDSTQSYEIGSKNLFGDSLRIATSVYYIKWDSIQQSVYVAGACGLQFTDNLGTAVAWGGDLQAQMALGPLNIDFGTGYTSARYTKDSPLGCQSGPLAVPCKSSNGDAISGQAAIDYAPGLNSPFTVALGVEYGFNLGQHTAFVRADWEYESRNPWLSTLQNPNDTAQYNPFTYTLPSTSFTSLRAGVNLGEWQIAAFLDNLFDSHTVTNYALGQPAGAATVQENDYTFRPRTIGITATWHAHGH